MASPKSTQVKQVAAPTEDDLIGEVKEKELSFAENPKNFPRLGQDVFYHVNDPFNDGLSSHPAKVTKLNQNGSVSLLVFLEAYAAPFSKVPLAKDKTAGYYTLTN